MVTIQDNDDKIQYVKFDKSGFLEEVLISDENGITKENITQLGAMSFKIDSIEQTPESTKQSYYYELSDYRDGRGLGYEYLLNKYGVQEYEEGMPVKQD